MDRRSFALGAGLVVATGTVGCLGWTEGPRSSGGTDGGGDRTSAVRGADYEPSTGQTVSPTPGTGGTPQHDDVDVWVHNDVDSARRVHLTLSAGSESMLNTTVALGPGEASVLGSGIGERGRYVLGVTVDRGPSESYPFTVGEYELRQGSDLVVRVGDHDVWIAIEE